MFRLLQMALLLGGLCGDTLASEMAPGKCSGSDAAATLPGVQWVMSPEGICVASVGQGRPVLFVHGWTMDHRDEAHDYEPVFRNHSGWRRMYVDLPGMGRSAGTIVHNQDELLRRLLAFADREFQGEGFAIAGTSAGAYLAHEVALSRPGQVTGVLLRMPLVNADDAQRDLDDVGVLIEDERGPWPKNLAGAREEAIVRTRPYVEALAAKNAERVAPAQALANRQALDAIRTDPARYSLSSAAGTKREPIGVPSLIMAGRQDASVGYRDAWRLQDSYLRATYVALDRAQHGFPIDEMNRRIFEALVRDWIARVEEAAKDRASP